MQIILDDNVIDVVIERKNNKRIYFRFTDNNTLLVTCHRLIPEFEIKRIIKDNEKALLRMYKKMCTKFDKAQIFTYLGRPVTKIFDENYKNVVVDEDYIYAHDEKKFDSWYKKECIRVFSERIEYLLPLFNNIPKFSLKIRKMKTRWGVNNVTKKIITLNSDLLMKDISLIDYVIVHELCHFYEANHSSRFWAEVEKRYPNYKDARKLLRS